MILDTTVLIDLYREARKGRSGRATEFLEAHREEPMHISIITYGEFAEGFAARNRELCSELLQRYDTIEVTGAVAWQYAETSRQMRTRGDRIGDNDLWIAATALAFQQALATRNVDHFRRVDRLRLLTY